ncbi:hypothetical protein [Leifsonia shinshuensis]|uniref:Uncharacterized protein n=1 Tax=Leifsonia shinshuensis TaxID=150026 RepID=A0A853D1E5_9MICO|nr:hypothetical protein [Leifsonia shinshuensis]NYJ25943.1 hypothetical protein [Leifsonia shinshuensis]
MSQPKVVFHLRYVDSRTTPGNWEYSDGMTIGYFSSEEKAQQALEQAKKLPGFSEDAGFFIDVFRVGATGFPQGFQPSVDDAVIDSWLSE